VFPGGDQRRESKVLATEPDDEHLIMRGIALRVRAKSPRQPNEVFLMNDLQVVFQKGTPCPFYVMYVSLQSKGEKQSARDWPCPTASARLVRASRATRTRGTDRAAPTSGV
jgi:hypothetical protein